MAADAGKEVLYLPHRFYRETAGDDGVFGNEDSPVPSIHFPFPPITGWDSGVITQCAPGPACFKRVHRAPVSTTKAGVTNPASAIQDMSANSNDKPRLQFLYRSNNLWPKLAQYADFGEANAHHHTRNIPQPLPLANKWQQSEAILGLDGWFKVHLVRQEMVVSSEPAIQDEVMVQLIEPMNMILRIRYSSLITEPLEGSLRWKDNESEKPAIGGRQGAFMPQWGRGCPKAHRNGAHPRHAGYPDFVLFRDANHCHHGAISEVKTSWTYPSRLIRDIVSEATTDANTGSFLWDRVEENAAGRFHTKVIKQIWGELHFFKSDWGFWTNGSIIFIFVRTGMQELTCSDVKEITDPDVLKVLVGLMFASIDDLDPVNQVKDILCPEQDRKPGDEAYEAPQEPDLDSESDADDDDSEIVRANESDSDTDSDANDEGL